MSEPFKGPKWLRKLQVWSGKSIFEVQVQSRTSFKPLLRASTAFGFGTTNDDDANRIPQDEHERQAGAGSHAEEEEEEEEEEAEEADAEEEYVSKVPGPSKKHLRLDDEAWKAEKERLTKRYALSQDNPEQSRGNKRRRIHRLVLHEEHGHLIPGRITNEKYRQGVEEAIPIKSALEDAVEDLDAGVSVADPYVGKIETLKGAKTRYTVEKLKSMGFQLIEWDGIHAVPITDASGLIIVILVGRPEDETYTKAIDVLYDSLTESREESNFTTAEKTHRRGVFATATAGVGFPASSHQPVLLQGNHEAMLEQLLSKPEIQRIASFQSAALARWAPKNYRYYHDQLRKFRQKLPDIKELFRKSVFTTATFNFGPKTWTYKHRDASHAASGLSAITAAGNYDAKKTGHLILWELKMVIEFPSASTVLVPTATVTHSHIPVDKSETRVSFMQYTPGVIFKWLDNGGRTDQELQREDPFEYVKMYEMRDERWEEGLERFSTLDELIKQKN